MPDSQTSAQVDAEAADWVARQDRGDLDARERASFEAWLAADSRRMGAYMRSRALLLSIDRSHPVGAIGLAPSPVENSPPDRAAAAAALPSRRRFLQMGAGAVIGAAFFVPIGPPRYATAMGQVLRVPLSDGSTVTLNTDSEIEVDYSRTARTLRLRRGEAMFDMKRDAARPATIRAGGYELRTTRSTCTVRCDPGRVALTVLDGRVDLEAPQGGGTVQRQQSATLSPTIAFAPHPVDRDSLSRDLLWREGKIALSSDTLEQAAALYARYSPIRIRIDDPRVRAMRITGLFSTTDPVAFAHAASIALDLRATETDGEVALTLPQ